MPVSFYHFVSWNKMFQLENHSEWSLYFVDQLVKLSETTKAKLVLTFTVWTSVWCTLVGTVLEKNAPATRMLAIPWKR